jgi:folate-binding protein YgfZ
VQFHDRSDELAELCFVGSPAGSLSRAVSEDLAAELTDVLLAELPPLGTTTRPLNGVWLRRVDWLLQPAYLTLGSQHAIEALQARLLQPGFETPVLGTAAEWDALRIDAGFPAYGVDITDDHLPQEVGRTARCISFTKGCYLGQEPIARLDAMGHTNRELRRLLCDGTEVPAPGTELRDAATDQVVGQITSAAANPHGDGAVALGYLKSKWTTPGTHVRLPDGTAVVRPPEAQG